MPSQIENRVEKLENSLPGAAGVAVVFEDDDRPLPDAGTVVRVRFVSAEDHRHYDQAQS